MEVPDGWTRFFKERRPVLLPIEWQKLVLSKAEIHFACLDNRGIIYDVKKSDGLWRPFWWYRGAMRPLSRGSVRGAVAVALLEDIARRSTKRGHVYGRPKRGTRVQSFRMAKAMAEEHRIWEA
jgi:hypothetical protein